MRRRRAINHTLMTFNRAVKVCSKNDLARSYGCLVAVYLLMECVCVSVCALLGSLTLTADLINTDPTLAWHLVHLLSLCSTDKLLYCFILWVVERGKSESSKTGFINSITGNY